MPKVCCALQCFPLGGFGGKKFNLFLLPGDFLHCTCAGWKQVSGGKFVWMRGWRKRDETSWLRLQRPRQAQNSADPTLNLWNQGDLEGNVKDGKKGWINFSSN